MQLEQILDELQELGALHLLGCGRRGIEKEGLRYTADGKLSERRHPEAYGSPLTHSEITTDYAESLLEIVTPAFRNSRDTYAHLCYLHRVLAHGSDEFMLNASMPAKIVDTEAVAIGYYGESHAGIMRRLYRKGLALRYGKAMQLISGMHFNYSICDHLFRAYARIRGEAFEQSFVDRHYMNMVRNIRQYAWLTSYLFGHSPAVDVSFFGDRPHSLDVLDAQTLYLPYATSLRLSDIGYQNKTSHLVGANTLGEYIRDLSKAVMTPRAEYHAMGLKSADGAYQQINTHLLQIENEYYTSVRPKQIVSSGEAPVKALSERGIAYVELRTLDINCFERTGVSQEQLDFLELFMLYCLFSPAGFCGRDDEANAQKNLAEVAERGRDPDLRLLSREGSVSIPEWGGCLLSAMRPIAESMDKEKHRPHYVSILERQLAVVRNPQLTPSARILSILRGDDGVPQSHSDFVTSLSLGFYQQSRRAGLTPAEKEKVLNDAQKSKEKERQLVESSQRLAFEDYLGRYFEQLSPFLEKE